MFSVLLLTVVIPRITAVIPLFGVFSGTKLLGATMNFVLPVVSAPFVVVVFHRGTESFPISVVRTTHVSKLGRMEVFFRVFVPAVGSACTTTTIVAFVGT